MEGFSLENGLCPRCRAENSRRTSECHACGMPLRGASTDALSAAALLAEEEASQNISMCLYVLWVASGGLVFLFGAFLWCGNVLGFDTTLPGAGYIMLAVGSMILKRATALSQPTAIASV